MAPPNIQSLKWFDNSNDNGLSAGFAWLLNTEKGEEDAHATVWRNFEQYGDNHFHWTVSLATPNDRGFIPDYANIRGIAETMEGAKRLCEQALGVSMDARS